MLTLGKSNSGRRKWPAAFMQVTAVTKDLLSAENTHPTCRFPLKLIILFTLCCTTVRSVSSQLSLFGECLLMSIRGSYISKKLNVFTVEAPDPCHGCTLWFPETELLVSSHKAVKPFPTCSFIVVRKWMVQTIFGC